MLTPAEVKAQRIPILREVDLLVAGGGTAGAIAALAGARQGVRTLVVEQLGFLGGTQTGALVTPMMPNQIERQPLNGGLDAEINRTLNTMHESGVWKDGNRGWFNPEMLKVVLERKALAAGAELLYFAFIEDAIVENGAVRGAVVACKGGRRAILAARTLDCSGDGDLAAAAGVPYESGDPGSGRNQPFSVRFQLGNVDLGQLAAFLQQLPAPDVMSESEGSAVPLLHTAMVWGRNWPLEPLFRRAVAAGVLQEQDGDYFQVFSMAGRPGELAFNCPRISERTDGTDPFDLTRALCHGREAILRYLAFCREYLPGCAQAYLVATAPMVGVRESRRILGEYYLTEADVLGCRKFEDAIARNNYPIDIHQTGSEKLKLVHLPAGGYHEIPYRCLVPRGVDDLLVAGRCLSAAFAAQGSVRIQSNCRAMGEAAAVAAVISLRRGVAPRAIDTLELRRELLALGASL